MKKIYIPFLLACVAFVASADTLDEACSLLRGGDYPQVRVLLDKAASSNPKIKGTAQYMYLLGACEFDAGNYIEAERLLSEAKKKGASAANLYLGRLAFLNYDFDSASEYYDGFREYIEKTKQPGTDDVNICERQLQSAENALGRVENIVVIDSLALPYDTFFKSYRLPDSAGKLLLPEENPLEERRSNATMAYINEGKDFLMWGEPDSVGNLRLMESMRLLDGSWQEPVATPSILSKGGYADYPFMMPDGVTLYYASTGNDSMGGYDIFVATRDPQTGEYLQPQNIGMPFNSPYDDYMLAIDEENGVGWWATDRNQLGDKVTVYVYLVNDMRKNYDPDDENIIEMARLSDYRSTQNPADIGKYEEILDVIDNINPEKEDNPADFMLPVGDGRYYTHFEDFKKPAARDAMRRYLALLDALRIADNKLNELYKRYRVNKADNVKSEILRMESEIEQERKNIISNRSDIYRLENLTK